EPYNISKNDSIHIKYDHEFHWCSVLKPLVGAFDDGPGDAAVVRPVLGSTRGLAIGCGIYPQYSDLSAYDMAACSIDEAIRNIVSVGADPSRVALLDNFSWGSPNDAENMGALMRASEACYDVAMAYGTPFISGKDSLHNEYRIGEKRIVIPHTLLISAISIVKDIQKCITMDAKGPGDVLYLVGQTRNELGGSQYYGLHGELGAHVPVVDLALGKKIFTSVSRVIQKGFVRACHDLSEGGLAVAAAEMAFAGELGIRLNLENVSRSADLSREDTLLFSESPSRFLVEVRGRDVDQFEDLMEGVPCSAIGEVVSGKDFTIRGQGGSKLVNLTIGEMKEAWKKPLQW
ncbi:MAG: AIR synthase-related protein, partial [Planctomycetota bacterium]|nr:AIR synthase-related protein [Planctomycetota bacterium]